MAAKPSPESYLSLPRAPISVVLNDVRSLANVGLIFRLCDAIRAERLYLCGITGYPRLPDPEHDPRRRDVQQRAEREINKTAVMAVPFVPWEYREDVVALVDDLRGRNYQILAVEQTHRSVHYARPGLYSTPVCLILGHERAGVASVLLSTADACVEIPVYGMANSLNVAMACGLVGYEILRQQSEKLASGPRTDS